MSTEFLVLDEEAIAFLAEPFDFSKQEAYRQFYSSKYPLRWFVGSSLIEDWANAHFKIRFDSASEGERDRIIPGIWTSAELALEDVQFLLDCCISDLRHYRQAKEEKEKRLRDNLEKLLPVLMEAVHYNLKLHYAG